MSKKLYEVHIPFAGYVVINVKAHSEEEAEHLAFSSDVRCDVKISQEAGREVITEIVDWEWDFHKNICRGNVLYAPLDSIDVELIEEIE